MGKRSKLRAQRRQARTATASQPLSNTITPDPPGDPPKIVFGNDWRLLRGIFDCPEGQVLLPRVDSLTVQELGCTFGALVDAEDRSTTVIISTGTPPDLFRGQHQPMVIVMSSETSDSDETSEGIDIAMEHIPSIVFLRNGGATYYHLDQ